MQYIRYCVQRFSLHPFYSFYYFMKNYTYPLNLSFYLQYPPIIFQFVKRTLPIYHACCNLQRPMPIMTFLLNYNEWRVQWTFYIIIKIHSIRKQNSQKKKKKYHRVGCGSPPSKIEKLKLGIVVFYKFYVGWENQTLSDLN